MISENEKKAWEEDPAEAAFWEFDARHKGTGRFEQMRMSERDAFKLMVHKAVAYYSKKEESAKPVSNMVPIHPGEMLREEYLKPLNISPLKLAEAMDESHSRVFDLIQTKEDITLRLATKLAYCFNTSLEFWLNLQTAYDSRRMKISGILEDGRGLTRLVELEDDHD